MPLKLFSTYPFLAIALLYQLLTSVLFGATVYNQNPDYVLSQWTTDHGLPHNSITALIQTQDGYIWIGTSSGLVRFDGLRFTEFTQNNTPSLKNHHIQCLYEDANQVLWVGTNGGGLFRLADRQKMKFQHVAGLSNDYIEALSGDWNGNLWIATRYGLNRLNTGGVKLITTAQGLYDNIITSLQVDLLGHLWVGTMRGGLAKYNQGMIKVFQPGDGLTTAYIKCIRADFLNNILVGTLRGIYLLDSRTEQISHLHGTSFLPVTDMLEDREHTIWITSLSEGISKIKTGKLETVFFNQPTLAAKSNCLLQDRQGNIWIGSETRGLFRIKKRTVNVLRGVAGIPISIIQRSDNSLPILITQNKGLFKIAADKAISYKPGFARNQISCAYKDTKGNIYFGTSGAGVQLWPSNRDQLLSIKSDQGPVQINCISSDSEGQIWVGSTQGLFQISANKLIRSTEPTLGSQPVHSLFQYEDSLFIGTREGLYLKNAKKITRLHPDTFDVRCLYMDKTKQLWIGCAGSGIKRLVNQELKSCDQSSGLPDGRIFGIYQDSRNIFWFNSYNGVFKAAQADLEYFFKDSINYVHFYQYDPSDGMPGRHGTSDFYPLSGKSAEEKLYCATTEGVAIFDLQPDLSPGRFPSVRIEDILVNQKPVAMDQPISLPNSSANITINFTGIDFTAPQKLSFADRLSGPEERFEFRGSGQPRSVTFTNLDPGSYHFSIKSINNQGLQSSNSALVSFAVMAPFYSDGKNQIAAVLIIIFLIGSFFLARHKKEQQKQRNKYKTSTLDPLKTKEILPKLKKLLETEKWFLNPDLSLNDLAVELRVHYNHLSRIINENFGESYNDCINRFRIEEAKRLLVAQSHRDKTILELLYDCGFYSKSVFNTAFKKFCGITPSEFRRKNSKF